MSNTPTEILVLASPSAPPVGKGARSIYGGLTGAIKLDANTLQKNIASFLESVNLMLTGIPKLAEPYKVDEIELTFEVNAEGSIQLVGGVKAGASGGITLRMKR